jgi:hypothetical protein
VAHFLGLRSDAGIFFRHNVLLRNPITNSNWQGGKTVNITAEASGGHYLVPSECRLVARLKITNHDGEQLEQSVRFATDPIHTGMFSAGMLSINGTTVESIAANMRDQSILQLRMDNTTAGADMGGGTAGLLGFSQKMTQSSAVGQSHYFGRIGKFPRICTISPSRSSLYALSPFLPRDRDSADQSAFSSKYCN